MSIFGPSLPSAAAAAAAARQTVRPRAARRARLLAGTVLSALGPSANTPPRPFSSTAKGKQKAVDEPLLLFAATRSTDEQIDTQAGRGIDDQYALQSLLEYRAAYDRPGQSSKQRLAPDGLEHVSHLAQHDQPSTSTSFQSIQSSDSACGPPDGSTELSTTTPLQIESSTQTTHLSASKPPKRDRPRKTPTLSPVKARAIRNALRQRLQQSSGLPHSLLTDRVEYFKASLPRKRSFNFQEAALVLMESVLRAHIPKDADATYSESCADADDRYIATQLYDLSLADVTSSEVTTRSQCVDYIPRMYRQLLFSDTFADATRAAQVLSDPRLKKGQVLTLLYDCVGPLRRLCVRSIRAKTGKEGEGKRRELLSAWQSTIEKMVEDGIISTFKVYDGEMKPGQGFMVGSVQYKWERISWVLLEFLFVLAEFGDGLAAVTLCERLRNNIWPLFQRLGGGQVHWSMRDVLVRVPFLPPQLIPSILQALLDRNNGPQAALLVSLFPVTHRRPDFYEILLHEYGEGRLLHAELGRDFEPNADLDAISSMTWPDAESSSHSNKIDYPLSKGFQEHLWTQAMGHPRVQTDADVQLRLFDARMVSHGRHGSIRLVMDDLQEMWRRDLLPETSGEWSALGDGGHSQMIAVAISVLSRGGQIGVIQTFMASGQHELGGKVVEAMVRLLGGPSRKDKGKGDWESHILNAATEPLLEDAMSQPVPAFQDHTYAPTTPEAYVSRVRYLEEKLGLATDEVTRNTILFALARTRLPDLGRPAGPNQPVPSTKDQQQELIEILDIFVKCGVLVSPDPSLSYMDKYDLAPITSLRRFLHTGTTILKALVQLLFERGWIVEARTVLHWLKEGEKEAERMKRQRKRERKVRAKAEAEAQ